jgi:hypothetical protein
MRICLVSIRTQDFTSAQTGANKLSETNVSQSGKPYEKTRADRRVLRRGCREGENAIQTQRSADSALHLLRIGLCSVSSWMLPC